MATRHVVLNGYVGIHSICSIINVFATCKGTYNAQTIQIWGDLMLTFGIVNYFAVYLQYDFTTKLYSKLCFCMDWCCYSMFDQCIQIKAGRDLSDENAMNDIIHNEPNVGVHELIDIPSNSDVG